MSVALCFPRERAWHHREAFAEGFTRLGFYLTKDIAHRARPGDVLLVWNRMVGFGDDSLAKRWEAAGATVIVTENGWIGQAPAGGKLFALCRGQHNGVGWWPEKEWAAGALAGVIEMGDAHLGATHREYQSAEGSASPQRFTDRWGALNVPVKPWRTAGNHVLLLAQRGFGPPEVAQPKDWIARTTAALRAATRRPIVVREHPGRHKDRARPLEDDLRDCWAVVTWGSGAAIKAIAAGIPVFYGLKGWIGAPAGIHINESCVETPFLGDRLPMFRRLAFAQWSAVEIESGEPIRRLLP